MMANADKVAAEANAAAIAEDVGIVQGASADAVSYTHLTLPTIRLV